MQTALISNNISLCGSFSIFSPDAFQPVKMLVNFKGFKALLFLLFGLFLHFHRWFLRLFDLFFCLCFALLFLAFQIVLHDLIFVFLCEKILEISSLGVAIVLSHFSYFWICKFDLLEDFICILFSRTDVSQSCLQHRS